jgi:hypothetical protein
MEIVSGEVFPTAIRLLDDDFQSPGIAFSAAEAVWDGIGRAEVVHPVRNHTS